MANNLTLQEMNSYAQAIVASNFCGFNNPAQVITLALIAQDEGRSIGSVARDYHVIKGRPTLKADSMLARYQSAGGKVEWLELSNTRCAARFTHSSSGSFELEWTIEQAQNAELTGNPTWKKFPRAMLRARVISEGIRTSFPAVLCGTYTPEEIEDMDDNVTLHTPLKQNVSNAPQIASDNVKDAEVAKQNTPYRKFYNRLEAMSKENPEACNFVKSEMEKHGWKKPADVPAKDYEQVYLWYDAACALGNGEVSAEDSALSGEQNIAG